MADERRQAGFAGLPSLGASRRLADAVADALRDGITDGVLVPGSRLREVALAKQFGVSATPVREAFRRLEREGLIANDPHRGAVVATVSASETADLYEIHEMLESRAVRRAVEAGPHDLSRIDAILLETERTLAPPNHAAFNQLDQEYHHAVNRLSGNDALADLIEQIHRRIQVVRIRYAGHLAGRPAILHTQHRTIVEAIRTGDANRAEASAAEHIQSVRDAVVRVLNEADAASVT